MHAIFFVELPNNNEGYEMNQYYYQKVINSILTSGDNFQNDTLPQALQRIHYFPVYFDMIADMLTAAYERKLRNLKNFSPTNL